MGCMRVLATIVAFVAVLVGLVISGVPTQFGVWNTLAHRLETAKLVGLAPSFSQGDPWGFTFAELATLDLRGERAVVTGANAGLGYATALHLARQGAHVVLACRSASKCEEAAARIRANHSAASVSTAGLDTGSLRSCKAFGDALLAEGLPLHMLVLNAGRGVRGAVHLTEDGLEELMAVNHFGHAALFRAVQPLLEQAAAGPKGSARVVLVSSLAQYDATGVPLTLAEVNSGPAGPPLYDRSKLAQVLFAQEAARRLGPDSAIFVNSAHPGAVNSNIWDSAIPELMGDGFAGRAVMRLMDKLRAEWMWTVDEGALTQLFLAAAADTLKARGLRGRYFHPQALEVAPHPVHARNETLQRLFWDFTYATIDNVLAAKGA